MTHGSWFNMSAAAGRTQGLTPETREALERLDEALYRIWNLGDNVLLCWTHRAGVLLVLAVRHYAIAESLHAAGGTRDTPAFINGVLAGPKQLAPDDFDRTCREFGCTPEAIRIDLRLQSEAVCSVVSDIVRCYGVSLVRNRAVVLLD